MLNGEAAVREGPQIGEVRIQVDARKIAPRPDVMSEDLILGTEVVIELEPVPGPF